MRPFRFGLVHTSGPVDELARRAEDQGFDTLVFPDHLGIHDPFVASAAAAAATTRLRVGTQVVNNELRNPGITAQSAASVHLLSGGRFELGIGAGHNAAEHEAIGQRFPPAGERVERLAATVDAIRRLLAGEEVTVDRAGVRFTRLGLAGPAGPAGAGGDDGSMTLVPEAIPAPLPVMVGGNGDRVLRLGAMAADIVQVTGFTATPSGAALTHFTTAGLADRVALVREAAGDRAAGIELGILAQWVVPGDTPAAAAAALPAVTEGRVSEADAVDSPFLLLGPTSAVVDRLVELRERFGISYVTAFDDRQEGFERVVAELAGT